MKLTGTLTLDTEGNGIYEVGVDREDGDIQAAVDELEREMEIMLAGAG